MATPKIKVPEACAKCSIKLLGMGITPAHGNVMLCLACALTHCFRAGKVVK